jgi:hypothetical protein
LAGLQRIEMDRTGMYRTVKAGMERTGKAWSGLEMNGMDGSGKAGKDSTGWNGMERNGTERKGRIGVDRTEMEG